MTTLKHKIATGELEQVELHKLVPNPRNPNKHPDRQIDMLAKIIDHQGQRLPIIVSNQSGFIVSGHGRLQAITKLGWDVAIVDFQNFKNEADEYAHMIADNKIAELAKHDDGMMIEGIKEFAIEDFELLGLDNFELPLVPDASKDAIEDDIPTDVETRCKPGDIWMLGEHRLMCGDSTNIQHVEWLMDGQKADMVFTDPPYNVNYGVDNTSNPSGWSNKNRNIKNDNMTKDEYFSFSKDIAASISVMTEGCVYVCAAPGMDGRIMFRAMDEMLHCSTTVIWNKSSMVMGRGKYHNKYEPIWFGWVKSGVQFTDDRTLVNVWDFKRPSRSDLHPTMKPIELVENAIMHASKTSVGDLFGGSGSTLIACEKTNRQCFMMELDPHYCDVIVSRWEKYSEKQAQLVSEPDKEK